MTNQVRREIIQKARAAGYQGDLIELFRAHDQGVDLIDQFKQQQIQQQQQQMQVAQTPQEQQQGLIPAHQAGDTGQSMAFPNVQPNQSFTTKGLTAPIDMTKVDGQGNVVESYKAVPPGIADIPTGPNEGTMIETPASTYLQGGLKSKVKYQTGGENQALTLPDDDYGRMRQQAYADSLSAYNAYPPPQGMNTYNATREEFLRDNNPAPGQLIRFPNIKNRNFANNARVTPGNISAIGDAALGTDGYEWVYKKPVEPIKLEPKISKLPLKGIEDLPASDYQIDPLRLLKPVKYLDPNAGYLTTDFGDQNVGERVQGRFNLEDNTWSQSIVDKDGNVVKTRRSDGTTTVPEEDEAKAPTPKKVKKRKLQQLPTFKKGGTKCYTCGGIKAKVRYNKP